MLQNFVLENANNPGSNVNVNLAGPPAGRRGFLQAFPSGSFVFYFMDDGTQQENGWGTVFSGSPNILARSNPLWNSAAGANGGRLNFTGAVRIYNEIPAERAMWADGAGLWQAQSRRLTALAASAGDSDAVRQDQVSWRTLQVTNFATTTGAVIFSLPATCNRFRFEWSGLAPSVNGQIYARYCTDGSGTNFVSGATDYGWTSSLVVPDSGPFYFGSTGINFLQLTAGMLANVATFGIWEFDPTGNKQGAWQSYGVQANGPKDAAWTGGGRMTTNAVTATHVLVGAVGGNLSAGRARLLGATAW